MCHGDGFPFIICNSLHALPQMSCLTAETGFPSFLCSSWMLAFFVGVVFSASEFQTRAANQCYQRSCDSQARNCVGTSQKLECCTLNSERGVRNKSEKKHRSCLSKLKFHIFFSDIGMLFIYINIYKISNLENRLNTPGEQ